jgi:hypothetical protein
MHQPRSARDTAKRLVLALKGVSEFSSFVTSPRHIIDIADRVKQRCFIFSVHFLCFRLPLFLFLLLTFLFPSYLHHLLSSPTRFYSFVLYLSTGRKETDMKIKLQIWVFVHKQLLTLFNPEE